MVLGVLSRQATSFLPLGWEGGFPFAHKKGHLKEGWLEAGSVSRLEAQNKSGLAKPSGVCPTRPRRAEAEGVACWFLYARCWCCDGYVHTRNVETLGTCAHETLGKNSAKILTSWWPIPTDRKKQGAVQAVSLPVYCRELAPGRLDRRAGCSSGGGNCLGLCFLEAYVAPVMRCKRGAGKPSRRWRCPFCDMDWVPQGTFFPIQKLMLDEVLRQMNPKPNGHVGLHGTRTKTLNCRFTR